MTIRSKKTIGVILLLTYIICDIVARLYGLLPFGIMQGLCASIYIYIGYMLKSESIRTRILDKKYLRIGVIIWVLCASVGFLSLASIYNKLSFLQIIGALYGCVIFYWIVKKLPRCHFIESLGRDSLVVLCIHALDIKISTSILTYLFPDNIANCFAFVFCGKLLFVLMWYSIYKYSLTFKNNNYK